MKRLIFTGVMVMALAAGSVLAASNGNTPTKPAKPVVTQDTPPAKPAAKSAAKPVAKKHKRRHHKSNKSTGTTSSQPKGGTKK